MGNFTSEDILLAQESQRKYGVPASVTLAQYALESGYGKSTLAKTKNNYFGMRNGSKGWQSFDSKAASFDAHGKLLAGKLYSSKTQGATNVSEYVNAIAETYAPSSDGNNNYAGAILKIIEENNLTQYDSGVYSTGVSVNTSATVSSGSNSLGESILATIIQGVAVVGVGALSVVFFLNAFDVKGLKSE